jgi:CHAT domain-containing protein
VFHFAGHAVSGANESGLLLASPDDLDGNSDEPTLLSVSQLDQAVLQRLQLVVLSACATAETEKGLTEADTLVPGFLRAGVPHVVASRWPVDSYTTRQTMNEFYAALFDGLTPARALQQVANRLRLAPATTHPFYWAAFGVYGR